MFTWLFGQGMTTTLETRDTDKGTGRLGGEMKHLSLHGIKQQFISCPASRISTIRTQLSYTHKRTHTHTHARARARRRKDICIYRHYFLFADPYLEDSQICGVSPKYIARTFQWIQALQFFDNSKQVLRAIPRVGQGLEGKYGNKNVSSKKIKIIKNTETLFWELRPINRRFYVSMGVLENKNNKKYWNLVLGATAN